ncbi:MAG: hypothetical protein FWC89_07565 [Defluviitaleaceae bacterium]|nr:hypothetical protein [Defluviitaleaceae bacterium]
MKKDNWQEKLNIFLADFEHSSDVIGVLACGSYITGAPNSHSDLDVHVILSNAVDYRQRGNRIIDGLLIEYFANPPQQIQKYFADDLAEKSLMSQVQFATGQIITDLHGEVKVLKETALSMISSFYAEEKTASMSEMAKYFLWDMRDDLQCAYETNRPDFNFLYFNLLDKMISFYMDAINRPYTTKAIHGNICDEVVRRKYLLKELPDTAISTLITECIEATEKAHKITLFQNLTEAILQKFGGFNVDGYKLHSSLDI